MAGQWNRRREAWTVPEPAGIHAASLHMPTAPPRSAGPHVCPCNLNLSKPEEVLRRPGNSPPESPDPH